MNIYFSVILIILFLSIIFYRIQFTITEINQVSTKNRLDPTNNNLFCSCVFFILLFITGFRGPFTPDYGNYVYLFRLCGKMSISEIFIRNVSLEKGFALLNKIVYTFNSSPVAIMLVVGAITLYSYLYTFRKHSDIVWLSVILLLTIGSYYTSFNTMRQFMAGGMMFIAAKYLYDGNWKKYFISVLIVMTIHSSAIIMFLFYFLLRVRWYKKKKLIIAICLLWIGYTRLDKKNKVCTIIKNTLEENHVKTSKKNLFNRI